MAREGIKLTFDERVYAVEVIQKAAYRYIHLFALDMSLSEGSIVCVLLPTQEHSPDGLEHLVEEFKKEILDQHLRLKIKIETEAVRNLILGIAFSNSGLLAGE
jgi:His-Xaa-Ser system protein HxsD